MTVKVNHKLSIKGWLTFAETIHSIVEGPDFDPLDPRNKTTVDVHHRMKEEGAFGSRAERRRWAQNARKSGGA